MFYSQEEFEAQMAELMAKGYADDVAYDIVRLREQSQLEYEGRIVYPAKELEIV